jgi:EpsD family peptidyl-prolyl cis-trans isomerase
MKQIMRHVPATARHRLHQAAVAIAASVLALAGCGDRRDNVASQAAARVNKSEITVHQINFVLQQQRGMRPEQAESAGQLILEALIEQELAVQKGEDLKVDRDPRVVQQIEAAKREIIARAYLEKVGEAAARPTPEEVQKYYNDKPALFAQRRVYSIQEIAIEARPEQVPALREKLGRSKDIGEFIEFLKAGEYRFAGNHAVRTAEQLPLNSVEALARMKDGETLLVPSANGAQVVVLLGSRMQPASLDQARPAIEQFILNDRKRKLAADDLRNLRAQAKIQYIGKFAEKPASDASAPRESPGPMAIKPSATAPAASGLTADDISKGMSLK